MTMEPMSEPEQVELLTGPEAEGLLVAALGTEGATISSWSVHSLHHRPGAGVSVGYSLAVRTAGGATTSQYVCATTSRLSRHDTPGLVRLEQPALPRACGATAMSGLGGRPVTPQMVIYRPTRRCVLRLMDGEATTAFVKVVRPRATEEIVRRHEVLTAAGVPSPRVLHFDDDGLVLLSVATGAPM